MIARKSEQFLHSQSMYARPSKALSQDVFTMKPDIAAVACLPVGTLRWRFLQGLLSYLEPTQSVLLVLLEQKPSLWSFWYHRASI